MKDMKSEASRVRLATKAMLVLVGILLIPLLISIIHSGYNYVFDTDELFHVQLVWLYAHGYRPYLDIYNSVYTPLFGWLLLPVYKLMGFNFGTIYFTRYLMIVLFAIRVVTAGVIVYKIFGKRTALLFIPMFLVDPFVVFSSMQIRPDNLMMTVYTIGLLLLANAFAALTPASWFTAWITLSVSLLVLPKVLPSVTVAFGISLLWLMRKKRKPLVFPMLLGCIVPFMLFAAYGWATGSIKEIIMQAVVEAKAAYSYFPVHISQGNFYMADNYYVYGTMGKPLTWFYVWFLPLAAAAGVFYLVMNYIKKPALETRDVLKILLMATLLFQWASLFFLQVVFMQYYLPLSWLYALFTAVALDLLLTQLAPYKTARFTATMVIFFCFASLALTSIHANDGRARVDSTDRINQITTRWKQIPTGAYTFPNILFRPLAYPFAYGYFAATVPPSIINRLPSMITGIEKHHVAYVLADDYTMSKLPFDVQAYINTHYVRVPGDGELMVKKQE